MERDKQINLKSCSSFGAFIFLFCSVLMLIAANCCDRMKTTRSIPKGDSRTVEHYVSHQEEREAKLRECKKKGIDSRGDTLEALECRAAGRAAEEVFLKRPERRSKESYKEF